jgi:hypothetical protein
VGSATGVHFEIPLQDVGVGRNVADMKTKGLATSYDVMIFELEERATEDRNIAAEHTANGGQALKTVHEIHGSFVVALPAAAVEDDVTAGVTATDQELAEGDLLLLGPDVTTLKLRLEDEWAAAASFVCPTTDDVFDLLKGDVRVIVGPSELRDGREFHVLVVEDGELDVNALSSMLPRRVDSSMVKEFFGSK